MLLVRFWGTVALAEQANPSPAERDKTESAVEKRAEAIFPFSPGRLVKVNRPFSGWMLESVTVVRRLHAQPEYRTWVAEVVARATGTRQVFPHVRVMLYQDGRYLGTCFMPPRTDPFQEVNPGQVRRLSGAIALPRQAKPDAFLVDDVPEVLAYTSQEGVPADEAESTGKPVWKMQIDRQYPAVCLKKTAQGYLFQTSDGRRYIRLPNRETYLEGTQPPERLDPQALEEARRRHQWNRSP